MVELPTVKLNAMGFAMTMAVRQVKDTWIDFVASLEYESSIEAPSVNSVPFFMSREDTEQFARFLLDQMREDCDDRYPFVTWSLGIELSIFDPDEVEATVQIFLNVGMHKDKRVYAGIQGQVEISELQRFANALISKVLPSSSA